MFRTALYTSLAAAIFLTLALSGLSLFKFIQWKPLDYTERFHILQNSHGFFQWLFLGIILFIIIFIFYWIMQYVVLVPAFVSSLLIGGLIALIVEWFIFELPAELNSFTKLSVPFMITVIVTARFVFETASFHFQANSNEKQNELPYEDTVIK
ncbi:hypothetical protein [Ureibacillus manganicus]|uniref:Uncharacterized protein n=1 Tax=Ureibacillus manganicus DSM 26584 TaxID=1384049 RepID=A0A0A3I0U0_9BACL|nr:hypothetical protein [Ureibacillus manganicus]KGR78446.1 hypothetical protein CD29_10370 [Ureibacillus manganicus DSM 26584]